MTEVAWGSEDLREYVRERTGVSNIKREMYRQACAQTAEFISQNMHMMAGAEQIGGRRALLNWVLIQCRGIPGRALEFGVGHGDSLRIIASQRFVTGFDSFEGLPEDWRPGFPKGHFSDAAYFYDELSKLKNVELYKGWFKDTIHEYVDNNRGNRWGNIEGTLESSGIAFIHIDSDLYSSASDILYGLTPWIGGAHPTWIVFDEFWNYPGWKRGEFKAFFDWAPEKGWKFAAYNYTGESVAIRVDTVC